MAKKELTILLFMVLLSNGISIHAQTQTQTKGMSIRKDDSVYRERHYPLGSFLRKTIMKSLPTETQKQLFVAKIAKNFNNQGCWRWTGKIAKDTGYGHLAAHSKEYQKNRYFLAHRFAYEFIGNKSIPIGLTIDHLCKNRWCVNPSHLEAVTLKENILRGDSFCAINARKTHCKRGHPLSGDNLYIHPTRGRRHCKACAAWRHIVCLKKKMTEVCHC